MCNVVRKSSDMTDQRSKNFSFLKFCVARSVGLKLDLSNIRHFSRSANTFCSLEICFERTRRSARSTMRMWVGNACYVGRTDYFSARHYFVRERFRFWYVWYASPTCLSTSSLFANKISFICCAK